MVNKYYLTKVYIIQQSHILSTEVYTVHRALCLTLIKWSDDTEFNEQTPLSKKQILLWQYLLSSSRSWIVYYSGFLGGEKCKLSSIICIIIRFNAQGKFDQITGKVKKNKIHIKWNPESKTYRIISSSVYCNICTSIFYYRIILSDTNILDILIDTHTIPTCNITKAC